MDPEFARAFEDSMGGSTRRHAEHKAQQLCRQVQRALNLALAEIAPVEGQIDLTELFVEEVAPAPDCGHLVVRVVVPVECPVSETLRALREVAPFLRSRVALEITRKRAPELSFVPVLLGAGGSDE